MTGTDDEALGLDLAQQVLAAQPFSVLLGARLEAFGDGRAVLSVPLREEFRQQHGVAHGGVVGYVADNALTFAAGTVAGPDVRTVDVTVNYVAGARGERLVGRAEVVSSGRRIVVVRCDVLDVDGDRERLCAVAQGTVLRLDGG